MANEKVIHLKFTRHADLQPTYYVRAKCKSNNSISEYSDTLRITTKGIAVFTIKRGRTTYSGIKHNGECHQLYIINSSVSLFGLGIFNAEGTVKAKVEIKKKNENNVLLSLEKSFKCHAKTAMPITIIFNESLQLKYDETYVLKLWQTNENGNESCQIINGKRNIKDEISGLTLQIRDRSYSSNTATTNAIRGAFPEFYVHRSI